MPRNGSFADGETSRTRREPDETVDRRDDLVDRRHADRVLPFAETSGTRGDGFYETDDVTRAG